MTLKRNGLGQLGFHVQNDGIVTDVESTGFAYDAGLRKGSRLVEVCKIAVATMTHEELVELLRTSVTVKVTVIPPFDDGTPRLVFRMLYSTHAITTHVHRLYHICTHILVYIWSLIVTFKAD